MKWQPGLLGDEIKVSAFLGEGCRRFLADTEFRERRTVTPTGQAIGGLQPKQASLTFAELALAGKPRVLERQGVGQPVGGNDLHGRLRYFPKLGGRRSSQALRPSWPSSLM